MNKLEQRFLEALQAALRHETVSWEADLSSEDWNALLRLAEVHHVLPMIYEAVFRSEAVTSADPRLLAATKQSTKQAILIQMRKSVEFQQMLSALEEAGVTPIVVKGIVCRSLYPNPEARISSDEDILIPPEQFDRCHAAMLAFGMGLCRPEQDIAAEYEVPYIKKGSPLYIELHKSLFPPESEACGDMNRFFASVRDRRLSLNIDHGRIPTMSHTDHLFYLICHSFKHFLHSGFGIRQVCDICLYANAFGAEIDWDTVLENCREIRADLFAAAMFAIGERHLTFDPKKACLSAGWQEITVDEAPMLADLLDAGVYGNGSMNRKHSSNITLNAVAAEKRGQKAKNGVLKSLFPSAKDLERRFPYLKTKPYLLPVAWTQRILTYRKENSGASGRNAKESIKIGTNRVDLLRRYGIIR